MNTTFYLRGQSVYICVTFANKRLRMPLGIKAKKLNGETIPGDPLASSKLTAKKNALLKKHLDLYEIGEEITEEIIKNIIVDHQILKSKKTFFEHWREWIEFSKDEISGVTNEKLSARTIQVYTSTGSILQNFELHSGYKLSLSTFNDKFYEAFRKYILSERINENTGKPGCGISTFSNHIKQCKKFAKWVQRKEPVSNDFRSWKKKYNRAEIEPLKESELLSFYEYTGKTERTEKARLILLALCSTSVRISDYNKLDLDKHLYNGLIQMNFGSQKTRVSYRVPYFDDMYFRPVYCFTSMINKYGTIPRLSGQKLNDALVDLCKELEFTRIKVTSKTGRKTWASLNIKAGKNPEFLMAAGGWKNRRSFDHYVGIDTRDILKEFKDKAQYLKVV